jgi:hypothetical protein
MGGNVSIVEIGQVSLLKKKPQITWISTNFHKAKSFVQICVIRVICGFIFTAIMKSLG